MTEPYDKSVGPPLMGRADPLHDQSETLSLMASKVRDAYLREPYFTVGATDLLTLCREMSARGITDALVRDGDRLGIFTTTNLVQVILRDQPADALPVRDFTSFQPWTVDASDDLYDAMVLMLRQRIHRVLVRDGAEVVGILSQLDLMAFLANHSHTIATQIDHAQDIPALAEAAGQVGTLITRLHDDGVRVEIIAGLVGRLNRHIFRRLWIMLAPQDLRDNSCLIVMGSEGRSEQIIRTDQDNGLILRDGFQMEGLERITQSFTDALISFGYPPCPGGIMLSRPLWCQPLKGFRETLREWVHGGDPEGPMNLAIFLDAAAVAGDARLLDEAQAWLRQMVSDNDRFFAGFAAAILQFGNEGGWWRRLPGLRGREAAEIDIKKLGIFPIVHGARTLALQYRITAPGTASRLRALAAEGRIEPSQARDLTEALHLLMRLKLDSNLAQIAGGRVPDNAIRLADLGRLDRQALRDALAIVRNLKDWLGRHYHLEVL